MRRRVVAGLALLLAGSVAACALAGPAFAACSCDIDAASPWFTLEWQDDCPKGAANELEKTLTDVEKKQLLQRMAHGVAFASQAWQLVQNNPDLRASLAAAPIALVHPRSGPVQRSGAPVPKPDSALARLRYADKSSVARLYTVRLGTYGSRQAAATAFLKWKFLRRESEDAPTSEAALQESLLTVSWRYRSCAGSWMPDLFVLPPSMSPSGQYELDFRLLLEEKDARRLAPILEARLMTRTEVVTVIVTGSVLGTVLAQ